MIWFASLNAHQNPALTNSPFTWLQLSIWADLFWFSSIQASFLSRVVVGDACWARRCNKLTLLTWKINVFKLTNMLRVIRDTINRIKTIICLPSFTEFFWNKVPWSSLALYAHTDLISSISLKTNSMNSQTLRRGNWMCRNANRFPGFRTTYRYR